MEFLTFAELLRITGGKWIQQPSQSEELLLKPIQGFSTDSRKLVAGECFVALPGEHYDGHKFVGDAIQKGAGALLLANLPQLPSSLPLPLIIQVASTVKALEDVARFYRARFSSVYVGITGSVGKTTTKELAAQILKVSHKVLWSQKSFNNQLGVPLTLLQLTAEHQVALLEMGTNAFGEIAHLTDIVKPNIGVVTCVAPTHLEGLGSIAGVEKAKAEILAGMDSRGVFITNGDDPACLRIAGMFKGKVVTFGCGDGVGLRATNLRSDVDGFSFVCANMNWPVPVLGKHNVYNVLAAICIAREIGIPLGELPARVATVKLPSMRMERKKFGPITVISDCYNASPKAMLAALELLQDLPARRKVAVLGSMLELGEASWDLHYQVGQKVVGAGVDMLWVVGPEAIALVEGAKQQGMTAERIVHCATTEKAAAQVVRTLQDGDVVLLKASRRLQFELILQKLEENFGKNKDA